MILVIVAASIYCFLRVYFHFKNPYRYMIEQLLELAPVIYANNKEKGFWDDAEKRNKGEAVGLICSELYEAVEAHRKNKVPTGPTLWEKLLNDYTDHHWSERFCIYVKDTIHDEMADAVIRILDCVYGFKWSITPYVDGNDFGTYPEFTQTGNFTEEILHINTGIIAAYAHEVHEITDAQSWHTVLMHIILFCEWYKIDLMQHIQWKMKFNSLRPHKHGKSY